MSVEGATDRDCVSRFGPPSLASAPLPDAPDPRERCRRQTSRRTNTVSARKAKPPPPPSASLLAQSGIHILHAECMALCSLARAYFLVGVCNGRRTSTNARVSRKDTYLRPSSLCPPPRDTTATTAAPSTLLPPTPPPPPPPRASRLRRTLSCRPRKRIAPDRADGRTAFLTFSLARPRPPRPVPPSPNGTTATAPVRKERAPEEVTRFDSCGLRLPYARPVSSQSHRNGRQRIGLLGLVGARPGVLLREFHFARSTSAPLRPLSYLGLAGGGW